MTSPAWIHSILLDAEYWRGALEKMAMKRLLAVALFVLQGCSTDSEASDTTVSELLRDSARYSGAPISIVGFLQLDRQFRLYQSEDAARKYDISQAIEVRDATEDAAVIQSSCEGSPVRLTATLFTSDSDHGQPVAHLFLGDVKSVRRLEGDAVCWIDD